MKNQIQELINMCESTLQSMDYNVDCSFEISECVKLINLYELEQAKKINMRNREIKCLIEKCGCVCEKFEYDNYHLGEDFNKAEFYLAEYEKLIKKRVVKPVEPVTKPLVKQPYSRTKLVGGNRFTNASGIVKQLLDEKTESQRLMLVNDGRFYYGLVEESKLLDLVRNVNDDICEVITSFPCRIYFDVDGSTDLSLEEVKATIYKYFGDIKLYIMGYENDQKHSYHISTNHYITSQEDLTYIKNIVSEMRRTECNAFDDVIYHKNRAMKCVNQSKPNGGIQKIIEGSENLKKFFINSFIPDNVQSCRSTLHLPSISQQISHTVKSLPKIQCIIPSNMTQADMNDAKQLLSIAPITDDNDTHDYRWFVMAFCYSNGITFDHYIEWLSAHNPSQQRINKLKVCWDKLSVDLKNPITIQHFRRHMSQYYPELLDANLNTSKFMQMFDLTKYKPTLIGRIEPSHYSIRKKALVFNIGMGGGKTTTTLEYLKKKSDKSFVWLAPRQTLVLNTSFRMKNEFKIDHITHLDVGKDKASKLQSANKLIICNQSLHYLLPNQDFKIVVIDEIETVINSWKDDETHKEKLGPNFNAFINILKNAEKIILLDAFTTTKTMDLLESIGIRSTDIKLYTSEYTPVPKTLKYYDDQDKLVAQICDEITSGKKLYIFYAFKNGTSKRMGIRDLDQRIKGYVSAKTGNEPSSVLYFAESEAKNQLGNVNETWAKANYVITTSSITVGVNYEGRDFDKVYLFCSGYANQARDIIQSSMRVRYPKDNEFGVFFFDHVTADYVKYPDYYHKKNPHYTRLIDGVLNEIQCDFDVSLRQFCKLTNYELGTVDPQLAKRKSTTINELFVSKTLLEYSAVPKYDDVTALKVEESIYNRLATMEERLGMDRYYFDRVFKDFTDEDKSWIWNNNQRKFFKNRDHEFIKMIEEVNGRIDGLNLADIKVSNNMTAYISNNYSNTRTKNTNLLIIKTINDILGAVIVKKPGKGHRGFVFSEDFSINMRILDGVELLKEKSKLKVEASPLDEGIEMDYGNDNAHYEKLKNTYIKKYGPLTFGFLVL